MHSVSVELGKKKSVSAFKNDGIWLPQAAKAESLSTLDLGGKCGLCRYLILNKNEKRCPHICFAVHKHEGEDRLFPHNQHLHFTTYFRVFFTRFKIRTDDNNFYCVLKSCFYKKRQWGFCTNPAGKRSFSQM